MKSPAIVYIFWASLINLPFSTETFTQWFTLQTPRRVAREHFIEHLIFLLSVNLIRIISHTHLPGPKFSTFFYLHFRFWCAVCRIDSSPTYLPLFCLFIIFFFFMVLQFLFFLECFLFLHYIYFSLSSFFLKILLFNVYFLFIIYFIYLNSICLSCICIFFFLPLIIWFSWSEGFFKKCLLPCVLLLELSNIFIPTLFLWNVNMFIYSLFFFLIWCVK